jgi:hypothetical protein
LDGPHPVVGSVLVHNRRAGFFGVCPLFLGVRAGGISLNTLLGFETTSPRRLFALSGEPGAVFTGCFLVGGGRWRPVQGCGCCRPALVVGCGV